MSVYEDVEVEDEVSTEELDDSDVVYEIHTSGADFDVEGLVKRFERGDIYRPAFQRQFVWSHPQASKFIESILLGLPIPSVFLYREEETNKLLIVDGLQRLTTLHAFVKGIFPSNERKFRLSNSLKSRFSGDAYEQLKDDDRRRIDDTIIHAFIIQQTAPRGQSNAVFHIFDRLNSNGTPLQPQEMRAAIYHGKYLELIEKLNKIKTWREIFGPVHKRSKDAELILRFFALHFSSTAYSSPVNTFLNTHLQSNRNLQQFDEKVLTDLFESTSQRVHSALGKLPFRLNRAMNVAYFDSFFVAVASNPNASTQKIKIAYDGLPKNEMYFGAINDSTSTKSSVETRLQIADEYLS
jgi:uncharacterized protein with ParB-like and HNH nuclease domain